MSLLSYFLPVSEGCYHKSRCISQILVPVPELGVADICEAIPLRLVPPQTSVCCGHCMRIHLCRSWDCHMKAKEDSILFRIILLTTSLEWTSIVQIVITFEFVIDLVNKDCPHFLSFSFWEWAKEESDEVVEHPDLLLVVVLEGALVALLQPPKWLGHLIGPGNLSSCQGNLDRLW